MQDISGADLLVFARVLSRIEERHRPRAAKALLDEVEAAAAQLRLSGRCHPVFGDGSLMARCLQLDPPPEPLASDDGFLSSLIVACTAVRRHGKT
jgi:hypothetical protein